MRGGASWRKDSWDSESPGICPSWLSVQAEMCTKIKCLPKPNLDQKEREGWLESVDLSSKDLHGAFWHYYCSRSVFPSQIHVVSSPCPSRTSCQSILFSQSFHSAALDLGRVTPTSGAFTVDNKGADFLGWWQGWNELWFIYPLI